MSQLPHHRGQPNSTRELLWVIGIIAALTFLIIVIYGYLYGWQWTGLVTDGNDPKRTLWDWLKLLIVPVVLAVGGFLFTRSENRKAQEIADQRRQDDLLLAYLDQIGQLLLDKENRLRSKVKGLEARTLAHGRTYATLGRLDGSHKRTVVEFLYASRLIGRTDVNERPTEEQNVIYLSANDLSKADLKNVHLPTAVLRGGNFRAADLSGADLRRADLRWIDLSSANLCKANLEEAQLEEANLEHADLRGANLKYADLRKAKLNSATLRHADLSGADLYASELGNADLSHAKLLPARIWQQLLVHHDDGERHLPMGQWRRAIPGPSIADVETSADDCLIADVTAANLEKANLEGADLRYVNLFTTKLQGTNLTGANLKGAMFRDGGALVRSKYSPDKLPEPGKLVPPEGLRQAAALLKSATMPNGQKYEEWLKSKSSGEDGQNGGSP